MRNDYRYVFLCSLASVLALSQACSPSVVGEAARPTPASATQAMGLPSVQCAPESPADPLIVDLPSMQRADLEAAMKQGTVVVSYDCEQLRILSGCHAPGQYNYAGVSRKEDIIRLDDRLELRASLPLGAVKLAGALEQGTSLLLALVQVGKHSNIFDEVGRPEMHGSCAGATHFVRAANVGAFALDTGATGKAAVVAELFGKGAETSTSSAKTAAHRDGSLESCRKSTPDASAPPSECQSPLRLQLVPILASAPDRAAAPKRGSQEAVALQSNCPRGTSLVGGRCTTSTSGAHLCGPSDEEDCRKQCDAGSGGSCYNYGLILQENWRKRPVTAIPREWKDIEAEGKAFAAKLRVPFEKACDAGEALACDRLFYLEGMDRDKKAEKLQRACDLGFAPSCSTLAYNLPSSDSGLPRMRALLDRGCKLGNWIACIDHADTFVAPRTGTPSPADVRTGIAYLQGLCTHSVPAACQRLASLRSEGKVVPKDDLASTGYLARSCELGMKRSCLESGVRYASGVGGPKLPGRAERFFEKACPDNDLDNLNPTCLELADTFHLGKAVAKDVPRAVDILTRSCQRGYASACERLAAISAKGDGIPANPQRASELYRWVCENGKDSASGCVEWAALVEATDKDSAKAGYERACRSGLVAGCDGYKKMGGDPEALRGKTEGQTK